jgi:hypothetical protein
MDISEVKIDPSKMDPESRRILQRAEIRRARKARGETSVAPKVEPTEEGPTKEELEELKANNAKIVLEELDLWDPQVLALIGNRHPSDEAFLKGPAYLIRAYMHIARTALDARCRNNARKAELATAKKLSEVAAQTGDARMNFMKMKDQKLTRLRRERDQEVREATDQIRAKYRSLIREVESMELTDELKRLDNLETAARDEYMGKKYDIESEADIIREVISAIEVAAPGCMDRQRKVSKKSKKKKTMSEALADLPAEADDE